jgi:hypothetical protein
LSPLFLKHRHRLYPAVAINVPDHDSKTVWGEVSGGGIPPFLAIVVCKRDVPQPKINTTRKLNAI